MERHEVLDVGPGGFRRPSRWVLVVAVLAIVLGAVATYADHLSRVDETRALAACRLELHDAAVTSDLQMMAVATTIHPPSSSTRDGAQADVAGIMSRSAQELLPDVVEADEVCRRVSVHPWHFALRTRRDATTAYASALAEKLREVARDGHTAYIDDAGLRSLRRAADLEEFGGRS